MLYYIHAYAWTCGSLPTLSKTIVANLLCRFALAYAAWNSSGSRQDRTDAKRSAYYYIARLVVLCRAESRAVRRSRKPSRANATLPPTSVASVAQNQPRKRNGRKRKRNGRKRSRAGRASATPLSRKRNGLQLLTIPRSWRTWSILMTFTVF